MKSVKVLTLLIFTSFNASANSVNENKSPVLKVIKIKDQSTSNGPKENFIGTVTVRRLFTGEEPSNLSSGYVHFNKGARSNWHSHPRGQLLVVSEGSGIVQEWGKEAQKILPGHVIWTPPNIKHWHGASLKKSMGHTTASESMTGKAVEWMEPVTDEQYKLAISQSESSSSSFKSRASVYKINTKLKQTSKMN